MTAVPSLVPQLLRSRVDFRRFWLGQTVSVLGDQVTLIALPLLAVLQLDVTAAQMGFLTAAALLPNLLFSLHAGAFVDRRGERRRTMMAADLVRAALLTAIPATAALGILSLPALCVLAFLIGSASVLFNVSYSTLFVALVPPRDYVGATSLLNGSRAFANAAGPSLGGLLVQLVTAPAAIAVDAASFLASALFLHRISPTEPPREERRQGLLLDGVRYIARSGLVRSLLAATATVNFFNFMFFALFFLYVSRELRVAPAVLGFVLGAGAVGGLLGSVVTAPVVRRVGVGRAAVLGCLLFPAPLVLVPLAGHPGSLVLPALFAAEFGSGLGVMMLDISVGAIFAAAIPDRLRARVSGAYMTVNYGVRPLGSLVAGVLGSSIGLRPTLWLATVGGALGALWLLPSPLPRMRDLPAPPESGEAGGDHRSPAARERLKTA